MEPTVMVGDPMKKEFFPSVPSWVQTTQTKLG
jgi:hypothetical protein